MQLELFNVSFTNCNQRNHFKTNQNRGKCLEDTYVTITPLVLHADVLDVKKVSVLFKENMIKKF